MFPPLSSSIVQSIQIFTQFQNYIAITSRQFNTLMWVQIDWSLHVSLEMCESKSIDFDSNECNLESISIDRMEVQFTTGE